MSRLERLPQLDWVIPTPSPLPTWEKRADLDQPGSHYLYVIECAEDTYVGETARPIERGVNHLYGKGSNATVSNVAQRACYLERIPTSNKAEINKAENRLKIRRLEGTTAAQFRAESPLDPDDYNAAILQEAEARIALNYPPFHPWSNLWPNYRLWAGKGRTGAEVPEGRRIHVRPEMLARALIWDCLQAVTKDRPVSHVTLLPPWEATTIELHVEDVADRIRAKGKFS